MFSASRTTWAKSGPPAEGDGGETSNQNNVLSSSGRLLEIGGKNQREPSLEESDLAQSLPQSASPRSKEGSGGDVKWTKEDEERVKKLVVAEKIPPEKLMVVMKEVKKADRRRRQAEEEAGGKEKITNKKLAPEEKEEVLLMMSLFQDYVTLHGTPKKEEEEDEDEDEEDEDGEDEEESQEVQEKKNTAIMLCLYKELLRYREGKQETQLSTTTTDYSSLRDDKRLQRVLENYTIWRAGLLIRLSSDTKRTSLPPPRPFPWPNPMFSAFCSSFRFLFRVLFFFLSLSLNFN